MSLLVSWTGPWLEARPLRPYWRYFAWMTPFTWTTPSQLLMPRLQAGLLGDLRNWWLGWLWNTSQTRHGLEGESARCRRKRARWPQQLATLPPVDQVTIGCRPLQGCRWTSRAVEMYAYQQPRSSPRPGNRWSPEVHHTKRGDSYSRWSWDYRVQEGSRVL